MFTQLFKRPKTFASLTGDFSYWHQHREKYSVWAIEPSDNVLDKRFKDARIHLQKYILSNYSRQVHVTLGQCGFIASEKKHDDDYDSVTFEADIKKLEAFDGANIRIDIRGVLDSYPIAPFFPVVDTHQDLITLHRQLTHTANQNYLFTPHVTVGLYAHEWENTDVHQSLVGFPQLDDLSFKVEKVKLLSYDPTIIGGTLREEACFNLKTKKLSVVDGLFD